MKLTRREAMAAAGALALAPRFGAPAGGLKQSVARWCYGKIPLDELCKAGKEMGLAAIDLLKPDEWKVAADHGLVCSTGMVDAGWIDRGLNDPKNHDEIVKAFETWIPKAAEAGVPNVICFFGNRRGMEDAEGIDNSVACLERCKAAAEENKVTIIVELLNSKVDHADYIGDRTPYGAEVMKRVGSTHVKLLYDIYHMQIMEGDVIRTIRQNKDWIAHYHTGGVPGRAEIDETQELNYVAIVKAMLDMGFTGYCAHEFIPRNEDALASLRAAVKLCDV